MGRDSFIGGKSLFLSFTPIFLGLPFMQLDSLIYI